MTQEEIDEAIQAVKAGGKKMRENKEYGIKVLVELGIIQDPSKTNKKKKKSK